MDITFKYRLEGWPYGLGDPRHVRVDGQMPDPQKLLEFGPEELKAVLEFSLRNAIEEIERAAGERT